MHLHAIAADELEHFASVCTPPERVGDVREYLEHLLATESTRLGWCFVASEGGSPVGRCALWAMPGAETPSDLVLLDIDWSRHDSVSAGSLLVGSLLDRMRALGAQHAAHVLDTPPQPPQWQHDAERRMAVLGAAGFALDRETRRFEWVAGPDEAQAPTASADPATRETDRLVYRTLDEVGDDAFIAAIERITQGTFDRRLRREREELGPLPAARGLFALLQTFTYQSSWWQLAYTPHGELVGLIMPAAAPRVAVIGYIGVVPEQRGHSYGAKLLARATAILRASGAARIVADTDTGNNPMARAFRQVGYREFATRREYARELRPNGA